MCHFCRSMEQTLKIYEKADRQYEQIIDLSQKLGRKIGKRPLSPYCGNRKKLKSSNMVLSNNTITSKKALYKT